MKDGKIEPGQAPEHWGFSKENFEDGSYLWITGKTCTVSFIVSQKKGDGAFSRLVRAMENDGLQVEVPTPLPLMQAIIERWGFKRKSVWSEDFGEHVEVWTR